MINIDEIRLEERNISSAITWGIVSGIFFGLLNYLLLDDRLLDTYDSELPYLTVVVMYLAATIAVVAWVMKIAKKLNRPPFLWGFFAVFFPPVTLIILGFQDYKIGDRYIKGILDLARLDFNAEMTDIKKNQNLTSDELKRVELKLKEKYMYDLRKRIRESMSDLNQRQQEQEEEVGKAENSVDYTEEEVSLQPESGQPWANDINRCPACGAAISASTAICPDCGLTLK